VTSLVSLRMIGIWTLVKGTGRVVCVYVCVSRLNNASSLTNRCSGVLFLRPCQCHWLNNKTFLYEGHFKNSRPRDKKQIVKTKTFTLPYQVHFSTIPKVSHLVITLIPAAVTLRISTATNRNLILKIYIILEGGDPPPS